jgi:MFS family permease
VRLKKLSGLGWAIDRFGTRRSLALHYAAGIVFIGLISLFVLPYLALLAVVLLSGVTVIGSQTGLNAACGKLYPARMRTSGYGFATGVGRLGGIAAAPLGGFLLARGLPPTYVFLSALPVCGNRCGGDRVPGIARPAGERHHGDGGGVVKVFVFDLLADDANLDH